MITFYIFVIIIVLQIFCRFNWQKFTQHQNIE